MATEARGGAAAAAPAATAGAARGERGRYPVAFAALVGHAAVAALLWGGYFVVFVHPALSRELARVSSPGEVPEWRACYQSDERVMETCTTVVFGCLAFAFVRLLMCVGSIDRRVKAAQSGAHGSSQRCAAVAVVHGPLVVFSGGSFCLWSQEVARPAVCDDKGLRSTVFMFALWGLLISMACCLLVILHAGHLPSRPRRLAVQPRSVPAVFVGDIATVPYDRGLFGEGGGARYHAECPICLEMFGPGVEIKVLRCGHAFHTGCLERWLQRKRACALCRQEVALAPAGEAFEAVVPAGARAAEAAAAGAARPRPALVGRDWRASWAAASQHAHEARPGRSGQQRPRASSEPPASFQEV